MNPLIIVFMQGRCTDFITQCTGWGRGFPFGYRMPNIQYQRASELVLLDNFSY